MRALPFPAGHWVRRDLMTTDATAAAAFYTALFGWRVETKSLGGFEVKTLVAGEDTLGAIISLGDAPMASHWMPYLAVNDIAATCARAKAAGGAVCQDPFVIPGFGRFAIIEDPRGGYSSPVQLEAPEAVPDRAIPPVGRFCWQQLLAGDAEAVLPFYAETFGWQTAKLPMPGHPVWTVSAGERAVGTIMQKPSDADRSVRDHWLGYVAVADCAASHAEAEALGAKTHVPPTPMPGAGIYAVIADPTGAEIALWEDITQSKAG